jgi:hypothetical protein
MDPKDLPDALKAWVRWVLHGEETATCPLVLGEDDASRCGWPSRLKLELDDRGGRFAQEWQVHGKGFWPLPGDEKRWPQAVTVDRKPAVVLSREGVPSVLLGPGDHAVSGSFRWQSLPESLRLPPETGLLTLAVKGRVVERPNRQTDGLVFLQKVEAPSEGERLAIVVHRKVTDDIPLLLTTRLVLNVAGKNRELLLGRSLPPGFMPLSLGSQLPTRLEPDSRVRIQARPGTWTITITARSIGPQSELRRPRPDGPWREGEEVWVFEAMRTLRLVTVEGVSAIDPQQTSLPDDWKRLPAYPMKISDTMRLSEKRRGDAEPPMDRLTLSRSLWLDFDGRGFTASDTISGEVHRATRLEMAAPGRLGRVSIGGRDQFITHLGEARRTGVELRQGTLDLTADSRIEAAPSSIPAVGWRHDFHRVSAELHLPPGFRLLHATGVDEVTGTWVKHWTLLEMFLVLVLSIAVARLFGVGWGVMSLITLTLIFPEEDAPRWVWIAALAMEALVRAVPQGRLQRVLVLGRHLAGVALVLLGLPFLVAHVRGGLYPALDREISTTPFSDLNLARPAQEAGIPRQTTVAGPQGEVESQDGKKGQGGKLYRSKHKDSTKSGLDSRFAQYNVETYDPQAMVQTGPGRPRWRWHAFSLGWSGPVESAQQLRLIVLPPWANLALALLRALLLVILALKVLPWRLHLAPRLGAPTVVLALLVALVPSLARADLPSAELLDKMRERLLAKPECAPSCASSPRMSLEVRPDWLLCRMEIAALAPTAVPLPGKAAQWTAERVLLDGKPAKALARDEEGTLWLLAGPGIHQALLEGRMPARESVQLTLPLRPHRLEATVSGWRLEGLHEDGVTEEDLQLTRLRMGGDQAGFQPGTLPPFVRVERTIRVGLNWQAETRVVRETPLGVAVVLEIPLLPGESVTTAEVRVVDGKALVNMGPQAKDTSWSSVLRETSPIVLAAPRSTSWTEVWRLDASPIWHAVPSGIPPVHPEIAVRLPEWRPWPGERVSIALSRPAGVPGQTITIDESRYQLTPGQRATDAQLSLEIRSSRGAEHSFSLPGGATAESVEINGQSQLLRQVGSKVALTLAPGAQRVRLTWRDTQGIRSVFRAPALDLGAPSVNANTEVTLSHARWTLFVGGPRLGPVVRFWSLLLVLLVVALALGQVRWVPLRSWHWMLLAVGLAPVEVTLAAVVVGWLLLLGWRGRSSAEPSGKRLWFNVRQILIPLWTLVALGVLVVAVHGGLLGQPDMQIQGNGSTSSLLRWFQDRTGPVPESPWVLSVPLLVYRAAMLAWALWLALSVLRWLRWGWGTFGRGGMWKPRPEPPAADAPTTGAPAEEERQ